MVTKYKLRFEKTSSYRKEGKYKGKPIYSWLIDETDEDKLSELTKYKWLRYNSDMVRKPIIVTLWHKPTDCVKKLRNHMLYQEMVAEKWEMVNKYKLRNIYPEYIPTLYLINDSGTWMMRWDIDIRIHPDKPEQGN
jgi:hypothetical protein